MNGAYQIQTSNGDAQCLLCPHQCVLHSGERGTCFSRRNEEGTIVADNYMQTVQITLDPIEKKPLRNYHTGSMLLSIGPNGCNFRCPFCQNHIISQEEYKTKPFTPESLIRMAHGRNALGIAYTYAEPFIWFETLRDTMPAVREAELKNVVVTNGFVNVDPLQELLPYIDAMNIDLKSFDPEMYKSLGGSLSVVLRTIRLACDRRVHVEVSYILTPGNEESVLPMAQCLAMIGDIPLHILRYYPAYKMMAPATPMEVVAEARNTARKYLTHVY